MDFIAIKWISFGTITVILMAYGYWFTQYRLGVPKAYNNFMELLIAHKNVLEQDNFYTQIENDYSNRKLPSFEPEKFKAHIMENSILLDNGELRKILLSLDSFMHMLEASVMLKAKKGYQPKYIENLKIKPYISIPKKLHILIIVALGVSISIYILIKPLAEEQLLNEYKSVGIESLDERYLSEDKELESDAEIIDRIYKSRFFGGAYYKLEVQITEPINKTYTLEVDPVLYQEKKIGDSLLVNIKYTIDTDRLKDTESLNVYDITILE